MWIEIFKTGTHNTNADTKTYTKEDIDTIVSKYDPKVHEAPIVIGHPKDNAPAFGWVDSLKREGDILYAKLKNLVPEFVEILKRKLFKKRSISLYPDLSLRHVGFLGAGIPAVKGLEDIKFSDENNVLIEMPFYEEDSQLKVFSEEEVKTLIEKTKEKAEMETRFHMEREFTEKQRETQKEIRKKKNKRYVDDKIKKGIIPPAIAQMGLVKFMDALDGNFEEITFSEGEKKKPLEWFIEFLEKINRSPIFGEIATKDRVVSEELKDEVLGKEIAAKANKEEANNNT